MTREKQLAKNTLIVAAGKICTQFATFLLLPFYTSLLSSEDYGTVDLLNTYSSLLIPVCFFQIEQAIFRHLIDVRKEKNKQKEYISSSIFAVTIQSMVFVLVYSSVCFIIDIPYKYFLAGNVLTMAISNLLLQVCRGLGDNLKYSIGSLISGLTTIMLNVLFIGGFRWGACGMLTAGIIGNVVSILFVLFAKQLYSYISIKSFKISVLKQLWKYSIPLIPNQLSWWIINASDRTIIRIALGTAFNGIYSAANKFSTIITSVFGIFNLTWSESTSIHINDKDASEYLSRITNQTLKLFCMICFGLIACMPFAFSILIRGNDYTDAYYQIPILLLSTIFNIFVSLMGSIYVALKKSKEIARTSAYAAIINLVVNIALVRYIGLYAASLSTLVAFAAMSVYRYIDVQKYVQIRIDPKLIAGLLIIATGTLTSYYINALWLNTITLSLIATLTIVLNFSFLNSIYETVKNRLIKKR